jgi:hypothetical protein
MNLPQELAERIATRPRTTALRRTELPINYEQQEGQQCAGAWPLPIYIFRCSFLRPAFPEDGGNSDGFRLAGTIREQLGEETIPNDPKQS